MELHKQQLINFMAESGILTFGSFITKSGRSTPYFVNFGNSKTGEQAGLLGQYYAHVISRVILAKTRIDFLYGPAYKGIPLVVAAAIELAEKYQTNIPFCFNRKENKDHGEGGNLVGYKPKPGDVGLIIEDVITAGTSVRESMAIFKEMTDVKIVGEIIAVDRMEKGPGEKSARQEAEEEFGIFISPIVTVKEIIEHLKGREIDGKVLVTPQIVSDIDKYLEQWGAKI
jgi:orotate phosphoribosyltransferase